jgi:hypothetical protein
VHLRTFFLHVAVVNNARTPLFYLVLPTYYHNIKRARQILVNDAPADLLPAETSHLQKKAPTGAFFISIIMSKSITPGGFSIGLLSSKKDLSLQSR